MEGSSGRSGVRLAVAAGLGLALGGGGFVWLMGSVGPFGPLEVDPSRTPGLLENCSLPSTPAPRLVQEIKKPVSAVRFFYAANGEDDAEGVASGLVGADWVQEDGTGSPFAGRWIAGDRRITFAWRSGDGQLMAECR